MYLRQSTSQVIRIGPFLDSTDGVTPETGLSLANTDVKLSKDGATFANKNSGGLTADGANGWYSGTLDTTDTATIGILKVEVTKTGSLPVWEAFFVLEEAIYDALFATSSLGYAGITELAAVDTVVDSILVDTGTTLPASLSTIDTNVDAILVDTGTTLPASLGIIDTNVDAILVDTGTTLPASLSTIDTNVDSILLDTGTTLPASLAIIDTNVDDIETAVNALNDVSTTEVNTEVVDVLTIDTHAEPGQGTPSATLSLAAKINYLFKAWRNKSTQTATVYSLFNDDAATVDHKATVSDDGTTATKGEVATGP